MSNHEHEEVIVLNDDNSGLHAIIAFHNTRLGPARGGTRFAEYSSPMDAMDDALALSRQMTLKLAFYGLPYGGGKAVILDDKPGDQGLREQRLKAFAEALKRHKQRFMTGPDYGLSADDLKVLRQTTDNIIGDDDATLERFNQATAESVLAALTTVLAEMPEHKALSESSVLIQGAGKVGAELARRLTLLGPKSLIISDLNQAHAEALAAECGAQTCPPSEALAQDVDIFMPCARNAVITEDSLSQFKARILCGAANRQLQDDSLAARLKDQGCCYVPDFVANGGAALIALDSLPESSEAALTHVRDKAKSLVKDLCQAAQSQNRSLFEQAMQVVEERLAE